VISGFQNFLHLALGLPNGWTRSEQVDGFIPLAGRTSEKKRKRRLKADKLREELLAVVNLPLEQQERRKRLEKLLFLVAQLDD
jgi:hypothetical protein